VRGSIKILAIAILIAMLLAGTFVVPITMALSGKTVKPYSAQNSDDGQSDQEDSGDEGTTDEGQENETISEEPESETNETSEEVSEEEEEGYEEYEEHEEEETHEIEDEEEEHELHVMDEEDKVRIMSEDNEIEFKKEKPRLRFEYITEDGYEIEFEVRYKEIYEFVDINENGKMDSDEIVFEMDLENLPWNVELRNGTYIEINCTWYEIIYSYVSEDFNIMFVMRVYQKSVNTTDGGADEVKIDVIINKWSWHDNNSLLAILAKMEIEVETEGEIQELMSPGANETGIYMKTTSDLFIKYEWMNEILVDNEVSSVVASYYKKIEIEQEMEQEENVTEQEVELEVAIFTVYPHFETLRHDPSVGVEDDPADVQRILQQINVSLQWYIQPEMLAMIGILATAIVGVAAILKKNHKNNLKTMKMPV